MATVIDLLSKLEKENFWQRVRRKMRNSTEMVPFLIIIFGVFAVLLLVSFFNGFATSNIEEKTIREHCVEQAQEYCEGDGFKIECLESFITLCEEDLRNRIDENGYADGTIINEGMEFCGSGMECLAGYVSNIRENEELKGKEETDEATESAEPVEEQDESK